MYNFLQILKDENINIERMGIVVQADCEQNLIDDLNKKVMIDSFSDSNEKNVTFLHKETDLNYITSFNINENDSDHKRFVMIDVNTFKEDKIYLSQEDPKKVVEKLIKGIEEKLTNVF